jgi:hypothetical protein
MHASEAAELVMHKQRQRRKHMSNMSMSQKWPETIKNWVFGFSLWDA